MAKAKRIEKRPDPRDAHVRDYEQHVAEAERLADRAHHYTYGDGGDPVTGAALAAEGQIHATLALAAAHMAASPRSRTWGEATHVVNVQAPGPDGLAAASAVVRAQRRIPRSQT
ncbi:hypothetical protein [Nocardiopsis sp. YSL2]|uniref:hypothetical protein n=1 Tax=Nocardiopsis sp. YSL2 TaxID=2939492 RepID=UPI0026F453A4|nr:hypothetical protein [Nocardiopsis sp. YSL2]